MDDLIDNLTGYFDCEDVEQWPAIGFEIDNVYIGRPERDVGIMERYVDDYTFDAWVGDVKIRNDVSKFAREICVALGDMDQYDSVKKLLSDMLDEDAELWLD